MLCNGKTLKKRRLDIYTCITKKWGEFLCIGCALSGPLEQPAWRWLDGAKTWGPPPANKEPAKSWAPARQSQGNESRRQPEGAWQGLFPGQACREGHILAEALSEAW